MVAGREWRHLNFIIGLFVFAILTGASNVLAATNSAEGSPNFSRPLDSYAPQPETASILDILRARVAEDSFNLVATIIFFLAIAHTFAASTFLRLSHKFEQEHHERLARSGRKAEPGSREEVSFKAQIFHFLGEIEAIFGIWTVPLLIAIVFSKGWSQARDYIGHGLNFTEPLFVVVIMSMAASRPILKLSEQLMELAAAVGYGSPAAWWLSILTIGPILGSFITEPAAMTISALLLCEKFYPRKPSAKFAYATLGLLFVNISVGGTLTHFAAPPVLMVASRWNWTTGFMLAHFGWKAALGIVAANTFYFLFFRQEFKRLGQSELSLSAVNLAQPPAQSIPVWITSVHVFFLAWTVFNSHYPALFVGGLLFYLAFTQVTEPHQGELSLRPALMVGFFLAGLVVHGQLQGWWIQPVLTRLSEVPLFAGAAV